MPPKVYRGERLPSGKAQVTVDGQPLRVVAYHADQFSWGYSGSGPATLSLSILADHFNETDVTRESLITASIADPMPKSWHYHQAFKRDIIAGLPQGQSWQFADSLIDTWLRTEEPPLEES